MSLRKRIRKQRKKMLEQAYRPIPGLLGLWISADPDAADVLFRVHRAVVGEYSGTEWASQRVVTMYAEIVRYDTPPGYNVRDCAPRKLKQHLPNKETYITKANLVFGRKAKKGLSSDFTNVVIRGIVRYRGVV